MYVKNKILSKLNTLTSCAMDLFLEIVKMQDESGCARGVHNKDICKKTGMSKQSFYNALAELKDKGIITYEHGYDEHMNKFDYCVTVVDNDFSYEGALKEGYTYYKWKYKPTQSWCEDVLWEIPENASGNEACDPDVSAQH